ncbi:MAG: hypothetical protein U9R79_00690 [Armatimonadota bacterium]|nr:hypothetical protein [Armatimonadota bacterium]
MRKQGGRAELWRTVALVAAVAALLATAMVPALTPDATQPIRGEVGQALHARMQDFPPPAPATSFGDHYYRWSHVACPSGEYHPPSREPASRG